MAVVDWQDKISLILGAMGGHHRFCLLFVITRIQGISKGFRSDCQEDPSLGTQHDPASGGEGFLHRDVVGPLPPSQIEVLVGSTRAILFRVVFLSSSPRCASACFPTPASRGIARQETFAPRETLSLRGKQETGVWLLHR